MGITFDIRYHMKVVREDIPNIPETMKERVRSAIEEKLVTYPERYGKPLRASLHGYRKLRVGDYRVVFRIEGVTVLILAILHRTAVYEKALYRDSQKR